ncbi:MAG: glycosyltransferase family 4 protein [Myxococcota bacterium]
MRVLVLSKYDRLAASTRVRFLQYAPYLAEHGFELTLSPLFSDAYLQERFRSNRTPPRAVVAAYARRLHALFSVTRWDLAMVHYELFPYLPGMLERALTALRMPYVYDFDDAIFHMYDQHQRPLVRRLLGQKLGPILSGASAVIAGSRYLAQYAQRFNAEVHQVPTVVDMDRYSVRSPSKDDDRASPLTVGWIGSPSTSAYLAPIAPALERFAARHGGLRLVAVGARPFEIPGVEVDVRPWSEATEIRDLHEADVGIMPLPDEPWARGKCAFKLIQYMAVGLPTVASPVGANNDVVTPNTGLMATTTDEWVRALEKLHADPALRHRMGQTGRQRVIEHYSVASQRETVRQILAGAVEAAARR